MSYGPYPLRTAQLEDKTSVRVGDTAVYAAYDGYYRKGKLIFPPRLVMGRVEEIYYMDRGKFDGRTAVLVDETGYKHYIDVCLLLPPSRGFYEI